MILQANNNSLRSFSLLLLLSLFLTACGVTKGQVKMINDGERPKVATVVAVSDDFFVYYYGVTAFQNVYAEYQTTVNLNDILSKELNRILLEEDVVDNVFLEAVEVGDLENTLGNGINHFKNYAFDEEDISRISNWGKARQLDFIAFLLPGNTARGYQQFSGNGIFIHVYGGSNIVGKYVIQLIDVNAGKLADIASESASYNDLHLRKQLSQEEINKITNDWNASHQEYDDSLLDMNTLGSTIEQASVFSGKDCENLSQDVIDNAVHRLLPSILEKMHTLLVRIGFAHGELLNSNPVDI